MLRIKLVKTGKTNRPMWRVVVVEKTRTGKGRVTDYIGSYNAHARPKVFNIDIEKYDKWIKNGAQPTDTVLRLKGKFTDKSKEYQKEVKPKVYNKKAKNQEIKKEVKQPSPAEASNFAKALQDKPDDKEIKEEKEKKTEKETVETIETPAKEVKEATAEGGVPPTIESLDEGGGKKEEEKAS